MGKKDKNGKEEEESGQGERKESYPAVDTFFYRNVEDCSVIARPLLPEWRDEDVANEDWSNGGEVFCDTSPAPSLPPAFTKHFAGWRRAHEVVAPHVLEERRAAGGEGADAPAADEPAAGDEEKSEAKEKEAGGEEEAGEEQGGEEATVHLAVFRPAGSAPGDAVEQLPSSTGAEEGEEGEGKAVPPLTRPDRALVRGFLSEALVDSAAAPLVSQLRLVAAMGSQAPAGKFLWENIYPQNRSGVPVYNPSGKYAVRLFAHGAWRRVDVDDRIAVDDEGLPVLPHSADLSELWPAILAKALFKLRDWLAAHGNTGSGDVDRLAMVHHLTGWMPERRDLFPTERDLAAAAEGEDSGVSGGGGGGGDPPPAGSPSPQGTAAGLPEGFSLRAPPAAPASGGSGHPSAHESASTAGESKEAEAAAAGGWPSHTLHDLWRDIVAHTPQCVPPKPPSEEELEAQRLAREQAAAEEAKRREEEESAAAGKKGKGKDKGKGKGKDAEEEEKPAPPPPPAIVPQGPPTMLVVHCVRTDVKLGVRAGCVYGIVDAWDPSMAPKAEAVPESPLRQKRKRTHLRSPFRERHAKKEAEAAANAAAAAAKEEAEAEERAFAEAAATPGRPRSRRHRLWVRPKRDRRRAQQLPQGRRVRLVGEWDADEEAWIQFSEFRFHFSTTATALHNLESLGTCATRQRHWPWEAVGGADEGEGEGAGEAEAELPEDAPASAVYQRAVQRAAQPRFTVQCGKHRLAPFAGRDDLVLLVDSAEAQRLEDQRGQEGEEKEEEGKEEGDAAGDDAGADAGAEEGDKAGLGEEGAGASEDAQSPRPHEAPAPVQEVKVLLMVAAGSAAAPSEVEVQDRCAPAEEEEGKEGGPGGDGAEAEEDAGGEGKEEMEEKEEQSEEEKEGKEESGDDSASQAEADEAEADLRARRHAPGCTVTVRRRALPGTHPAGEALAFPGDVVVRLHVSPGGTAVVPVVAGPGRSAFAIEVDGPLGYTVTCASRHPFSLGEETELLVQQPVCGACVVVGEQEGEAGPVPAGETRTLFRHRLRLPEGLLGTDAETMPAAVPVTAVSVARVAAAEGKEGEEGGAEGKEEEEAAGEPRPGLDAAGYPASSGLADAPLCVQREAAVEVRTTPAHVVHCLRAWLLHPASGASVEVRGVDLAPLPLAELAAAVAACPARVRGSGDEEEGGGAGSDESEVLLVVVAEAPADGGLGPCSWRRRLRWPPQWRTSADEPVPQPALQRHSGQYIPNARRIAFSDALSMKEGVPVASVSLTARVSRPHVHVLLELLDAGRAERPAVATARGRQAARLLWVPPSAPDAATRPEEADEKLAAAAESAKEEEEAKGEEEEEKENGGENGPAAPDWVGPLVLRLSLDEGPYPLDADLLAETPEYEPGPAPAAGEEEKGGEEGGEESGAQGVAPLTWELDIASAGQPGGDDAAWRKPGVALVPDRTEAQQLERLLAKWRAGDETREARAKTARLRARGEMTAEEEERLAQESAEAAAPAKGKDKKKGGGGAEEEEEERAAAVAARRKELQADVPVGELEIRGSPSDKPWEVPVAAKEAVDARMKASRSATERVAAERRALWEAREGEKARLQAFLVKPPTWGETHVPPVAARSREVRELAWADREQHRLRRSAAVKAEEERRAEAKAAREAEAGEREARAAARAKGSKGKKK